MSSKKIGARSRNDEEKQLRQQQIMDAALLEFDEHGYEKTSMSGIAQRSGLSRSLVNFYFGDKAGIHDAIEKEALKKLTALFQESVEQEERGIAQLLNIARAYVAFHQKYPGYFEALARPDENVENPESTSLQEPAQDIMEIICHCIEQGQKDGSVQHDFSSSMEGALTLWATAHGCILLSHNKAPLLEHFWKVPSDSILKGLETMIRRAFENPQN